MGCFCLFKKRNEMTRWVLMVITAISALALSFIAVYFLSYINIIPYWATIPLGACIVSLVILLTVISKYFKATKGCELSCLISRLLKDGWLWRERETHSRRKDLSVYCVYVLHGY